MPITTGHHGRPPDRIDELDNFLPEDKAAARDFLLEIKPLFPLIEIPAFWDDDEGIELIKHLSWYISATVVLADWTGSSTRFFPRVAHPMDIKGYWQKTLVQAQNALTVFPLKAKSRLSPELIRCFLLLRIRHRYSKGAGSGYQPARATVIYSGKM